ncbi:ornithine decarboxylase 1-like, partial [Lineus longissimus]|uniref:ornithine decarboxylase 1-like n=1 Tax=Lineus longissimus TaxID=88925 RepID=UPI00315D50C5
MSTGIPVNNHEMAKYEKVENSANRSIYVLRDGITPDDLARDITGKLGKYDVNGSIYITHLDGLIERYLQWKRCLPRVDVYYAIKCNDDDIILRIMKQLGVGFECASQPEVEHVLSIGVKPGNIIIGNPVRTGPFLKYLAAQGVNTLSVDSEGEMLKIKELHPKAKLLLRISVVPSDDELYGREMGIRFGSHIKDIKHLLKKAKELGLEVLGITYRLIYGNLNPSVHSDIMAKVASVFEIAREFGFDVSLLDICGGIPKEPGQFDKVGAELTKALDLHFPEGSGVRIVAEPGRYFASSLGTVYMNILDKRDKKALVRSYEDLCKGPDPEMLAGMDLCVHRLRKAGLPDAMYICNQSLFQLFSLNFLRDGDGRKIEPLTPPCNGEVKNFVSILYGMTCCGADVLAYSVD